MDMDTTHHGDLAPDPEQPAPEAAAGEPAGPRPQDGAAAREGDDAALSLDDPETMRALLAERENRYLRLAADFDNFRRRKAQELADRARYGSEDAARALIPALDNLRRAVDHAPEGTEPAFLEGVRMVVRQFEEALASLGVTPIEAVGARFDPALHEAIAGVETEVEHDTVLDELQRGYRLHDRVIRPSVVRVAHPAAPRAPA
jgi:molecular chaperone GrpE